MRQVQSPEGSRASFERNIEISYGEEGRAFLADLPRSAAAAASRWRLEIGEAYPLSYSYVCRARREDGSPAVLKLGVPNRELSSEIEALRIYGGQVACLLLEADAAAGLLLLEALEPGAPLASIHDDDEATAIAAGLLPLLARPVPEAPLIRLEDWFGALAGIRPRFGGGTGPFPRGILETAEGLARELLSERDRERLIHGDFHHGNVLLSERGWLAIDPKGVVGPPEYEVGPYMMNPLGAMPREAEAMSRTRRRLCIFSERDSYDRDRMAAWALCHSVLSAYWDLGDDGRGGEYALAWAEILFRIWRNS